MMEPTDTDINYRFMEKGEEAKVCSLVEKVFYQFVAPDFDAQGVNEFFRFADPEALSRRAGSGQIVLVAERGDDFAGIIEMRNCEHIAMLFVAEHGKGIAKKLLGTAIEKCLEKRADLKSISVNSSSYAEPVYSRMGFKKVGPLQEKNGIKFVPMVRDLK